MSESPDYRPPYEAHFRAECPVCGKEFRVGYHHPADQKLWHHMRSFRPRSAHRQQSLDLLVREHMQWWDS